MNLGEKLQYVHLNPVKRKLVARPKDWLRVRALLGACRKNVQFFLLREERSWSGPCRSHELTRLRARNQKPRPRRSEDWAPARSKPISGRATRQLFFLLRPQERLDPSRSSPLNAGIIRNQTPDPLKYERVGHPEVQNRLKACAAQPAPSKSPERVGHPPETFAVLFRKRNPE